MIGQIVVDVVIDTVHGVLNGGQFFTGVRQGERLRPLRAEHIALIQAIGVAKADDPRVLVPGQHVLGVWQRLVKGLRAYLQPRHPTRG
ncbi:hypothetical protein D3C84_987950 [compost metagenome]